MTKDVYLENTDALFCDGVNVYRVLWGTEKIKERSVKNENTKYTCTTIKGVGTDLSWPSEARMSRDLFPRPLTSAWPL